MAAESVRYTGTIVIDYVRIMNSMTLYNGKYDLFLPDLARETVNLAASKCMELLFIAQNTYGGIDMIYGAWMRGDIRFTFRHFDTVWALKGLLTQKKFQEDKQTIVKGLGYLIQLQDVATGAWKCTPESDVYTWSTCNALSVIASVVEIQDGILEFQYRNILERMWNRYLTEEEPEKTKTRKSRPGLLAVSAAVVAGCCAVKVLSDLFRGKE